MYLLVADETNQRPSKDAQFFVYGALFLPIASMIRLDEGIEEIRRKAGYRLEGQFKFDTRARPHNVSIEACTAAKSAVLDLCSTVNCKFIVHVILHEIIKNQDIEQQSYWAADVVDLLWHYREGDTIHCLNKGLSIRPNMNKIKVQEHKEKYEALFRHINELIKGA